MARLDEVEHARLEHIPARVHQVARDLSLPRLFDEPDDAILGDLDRPERARIVDRPDGNGPDAAALPVGADEPVKIDGVDDVTVEHGEGAVAVAFSVLPPAAGTGPDRLGDDSALSRAFAGPEAVRVLVEPVL